MAFHGERHHHAGGDGIQPVLVAQVIGPDDHLGVVIPAQGTESVGGFVFRSFDPDGLIAILNFRMAGAFQRAGSAAFALDPIFAERPGIEFVDERDLGGLVVPGGEVAAGVLDLHQERVVSCRSPNVFRSSASRRAVTLTSWRNGLLVEARFPPARACTAFRFLLPSPPLAAAGGGATAIVDDAGNPRQVFSGRPNRGHSPAVFPGEDFFHLAGGFAP